MTQNWNSLSFSQHSIWFILNIVQQHDISYQNISFRLNIMSKSSTNSCISCYSTIEKEANIAYQHFKGSYDHIISYLPSMHHAQEIMTMLNQNINMYFNSFKHHVQNYFLVNIIQLKQQLENKIMTTLFRDLEHNYRDIIISITIQYETQKSYYQVQ